MLKIVPKSVQMCFEQISGYFFRKNFLPSVSWRIESSKNFRRIKKILKNPKMPKIVPQMSKRVLNRFWANIFEIFLPSVPWRVESSKIFKQIKNLSKFQKNSKSFLKTSKRVLNMFRSIFWKSFLPSVTWRVESSKIFKQIKNFSKFQKNPKSFLKTSKRVLNMFRAIFWKKFLPSVTWRVESSITVEQIKNFWKFQKYSKLFLKKSEGVLSMFRANFFQKKIAQCSMEGRVFENFQKNRNFFKIPKMFKIVPKSVRTCFEQLSGYFYRKTFFCSHKCPNVFWTCFGPTSSKKILCPVCSMEGRASENFQKFRNAQKVFPKVSKRVLNKFQVIFSKNFLWTVFHGGSSLQLLLILMPKNADKICRMVAKKLKLRRPAPHAIILHCGTKSAKIATPNTLTVYYTRFFPTPQPYLNSLTRTPKSKPYIHISEKKSLFKHWWVVYAILLLCLITDCFITVLSQTQLFYIAELCPMLTFCWTFCWDWWCTPFFTLQSFSQTLVYCWAMPSPYTFFTYTLS